MYVFYVNIFICKVIVLSQLRTGSEELTEFKNKFGKVDISYF